MFTFQFLIGVLVNVTIQKLNSKHFVCLSFSLATSFFKGWQLVTQFNFKALRQIIVTNDGKQKYHNILIYSVLSVGRSTCFACKILRTTIWWFICIITIKLANKYVELSWSSKDTEPHINCGSKVIGPIHTISNVNVNWKRTINQLRWSTWLRLFQNILGHRFLRRVLPKSDLV